MNEAMMEQEDRLGASLTVLERRWDAMTSTLRELKERVAGQEGQIADLEQQLARQQENQEVLEREKAEVIARIEGLLTRFEELGA